MDVIKNKKIFEHPVSKMKMDVSIVIPTYEEEKNVSILHKAIREVMDNLNLKYEIIFVDDGSKDRTYFELLKLKKVKIVKLRGNYGQTAAMDAGFKESKGNVVITMDADLQNDPRDIPRLLDKINEGFDLVSGWRFNRRDTLGKKLFSKFANSLRRILISERVHDSGCSLKAYRKECLEDLDLAGEMHRFIPALVGWRGFKISEIKVRHYARKYGKTKYGMKRIMRGFLDLINVWFWRKYSGRPLHIFGGIGVIFGIIGTIAGAYSAFIRIFKGVDLSETILPMIAVFMILMGIQLFVAGLMADIVVRTYYNSRQRKKYSIEKIEVR